MLRATISLILVALLSGCATSITPPAVLNDPVTVYLTDEGIHSSVLLPVGGNRYMEYAKGDWNYAALQNQWPWDVVGALFFSQQGALGRRVVEVNPDEKVPVPAMADAKINSFQVERQHVENLLVELEIRYLQGSDLRENTENGLHFRRVAEPYGFFNNCNAMTKRSLQQLGCSVQSRSPFAIYQIKTIQPQTQTQTPALVRGTMSKDRPQER